MSLPDVEGIGATPLASARIDGLEAVVTAHDAAPRPSEAAILAHGRVVDALAATNEAVVPARFGAVHRDGAALRAIVAERLSELEAALARVRGSVELGVRVLTSAAEPASARSGAEYMHARLGRRHEAERIAAELHAPLAALARETTQNVAVTPRLLFSAAYLVPRGKVAAFRDEVERLQHAHPDLGLVCTGPWPPYSFATAEAEVG